MSEAAKEPLQIDSKRNAATIKDLGDSILFTKGRMWKVKKTLKLKSFYDSDYWNAAADLCLLKRDCSKLAMRRAMLAWMNDKGGSEEDFMQTDKARQYRLGICCNTKDYELYKKQALRLKAAQNPEQLMTQSFTQLFTNSTLGPHIATSEADQQDTLKQSNFRKEIIKQYGFKYSSQGAFRGWLLNIITGLKEHKLYFTASHIFAYQHGEETMRAIFGDDTKDELLSPLNGLLLPNQVETQFKNGLLTIVPDITDFGSEAEITLWEQSRPREYKIKVLDKQRKICSWGAFAHPEMITWGDLDGMRLQFPNDLRPRARYLHFHYCCQLLKLAWGAGADFQSLTSMKQELGACAWGTTGKYIAANQMRAFVDELGHEFEVGDLMNNATKDEAPAEEDAFVKAVTNQIRFGLTTSEAGEDSDDDEDEDEEDDEFNLWLHQGEYVDMERVSL